MHVTSLRVPQVGYIRYNYHIQTSSSHRNHHAASLTGVDVARQVAANDTLRITVAVLAANERVEAEGEGQAGAAVDAGDTRRAHALTAALVTQTARAVARCEATTILTLHFM